LSQRKDTGKTQGRDWEGFNKKLLMPSEHSAVPYETCDNSHGLFATREAQPMKEKLF
jgi:hypothetical protein